MYIGTSGVSTSGTAGFRHLELACACFEEFVPYLYPRKSVEAIRFWLKYRVRKHNSFFTRNFGLHL